MTIEIKPLSKGSASDKAFEVEDPLPRTAFMMCVTGERGSGKTVFIQNMIRMYEDAMDYIFILSPSVFKNDDYAFIKEDHRYTSGVGEDGSVQTVFKRDDIATFAGLIKQITQRQEQIIKFKSRKEAPNILLVLDDILESPNSLVGRRTGVIETLAYNGRHNKISCILAAQLFRAVSNGIRSNCDMSIIYSATNLLEAQKYLEEFVLKHERKQIARILAVVFDEPFAFIAMVGKLTANRLGLRREQRLMYKLDYPLIEHPVPAETGVSI